MSTPNPADCEVIDFGAHLYAEGHLPGNVNPDNDAHDIIGPIYRDPSKLLETMDDAGVDRAVLSQPFYMGHGDADAVAAANDALHDIVQQHDRFFGLAAIPTGAGGEAAAAELERSLEAGFNGGALETMSDGFRLSDEELEPVLDVADSWSAPILVHPKLHDSLHPDVLDDTYKLNAIFGREATLAESVCRVIHQGVLDDHPDLDLVFHHLGGNIASMLGRVHLQLDDGRWPGQEATKSYSAFKSELEDRVYLDTSGFFGYHVPIRAALSELPSSQILFGTDIPYEPRSQEELKSLAETIRVEASEYDTKRVLGENTRSLLVNVD